MKHNHNCLGATVMLNRNGGVLLAPHTSGPRDVPRCDVLSLLQKTLHYRGDTAETAAGLNAQLWTSVVVARSQVSGTAEPDPLFESYLSPKNLAREVLPGSFCRVKGHHFCEGAMRAILVGLRRGNARHRLRHVATRLPPAGPQPIFFTAAAVAQNMFRPTPAPPRRHCQRPQLMKGKSPKGSGVTVQIEQYLLCSALQLASCSSPAATASRLTSIVLPTSAYYFTGASQLLKPASTTPRSYGRRHRS
jgi:hypothetical protein